MVADCRPAAWTAATGSRRRVAARLIQRLAVAASTSHTARTTNESKQVLKYVVIAVLIFLLLLFIYSRLSPYFKLIGKIVGTLKSLTNAPADFSAPRARAKVDRKLVKCAACGTWVPGDRTVGNGYCSRACLEKSSRSESHRAAS